MSEPGQPPAGGAKTPAELILAMGPALFGRNWQSELADTLGVNRKTIRRWMNGQGEPGRGVWEELSGLMESRARQLTDLHAEVVGRGLLGSTWQFFHGGER
jgi:helix-turn-helix protein